MKLDVQAWTMGLLTPVKFGWIGIGGWAQEPSPECENLVKIATFRYFFCPTWGHNTLIQMKLSL